MREVFAAWMKGVVVWVSMVIFAGGETAIRNEGLSDRSESEVLGLIGDRLVYVKSKPASAWRANDAAFMVEKLLRIDGYRSAVVVGQIVSEREIVLRVNGGGRFTLGKVEVLGVKNGEEIEKIFKSPFAGNFLMGAVPYREADLVKGLDYVERSFKSLGYWEVELELKRKEVDEDSGVVNLVLEVMEGRKYRIGEPKLVSSDGRGVKRAAETWQPFVGGWATTENIMKMKVAMVEAFTSRGYPNAVIEMRQRLANGFYYPEFLIELGTRVKLSKVHSEGLERTKPGRVARIMAPLEGDWYDEAAMNKKVRQLLATGAFDSVWVESDEVGEKLVDVTLHIQEAKAKEITLPGGFESFRGPLFRAYYVDRNFRGKLRAFSTGFELSGRGALGEVKLVDPWWRGTDISHELRLFSLVKTYDGYTGFENGLQSSWKWNFSEMHSIALMLRGSFVGVDEEGLLAVLLGLTEYTHLMMGMTQRWDYRDSVVLPKDGWHVEVPVQAGVVMHDESEVYLKVGVDGGWCLWMRVG
jgi:outer membrane protein insertion porin family